MKKCEPIETSDTADASKDFKILKKLILEGNTLQDKAEVLRVVELMNLKIEILEIEKTASVDHQRLMAALRMLQESSAQVAELSSILITMDPSTFMDDFAKEYRNLYNN